MEHAETLTNGKLMHITLVGDEPTSLSVILSTIEDDYITYHEPFNRHDSEIMEVLDASGALIQVDEDPIEFLKTRIFNRPKVAISLPYDQARCAAWIRVWGFIRSETTVVNVINNPRDRITVKTSESALDQERVQREMLDFFDPDMLRLDYRDDQDTLQRILLGSPQ